MTANEDEVLFKSRVMCTICALAGRQNLNVQVHHIDGNHSNDELDNLIVLCHDHHTKAQIDLEIQQSMNRKLTPELLKRFRDAWIESCEEFGSSQQTTENGEFSQSLRNLEQGLKELSDKVEELKSQI